MKAITTGIIATALVLAGCEHAAIGSKSSMGQALNPGNPEWTPQPAETTAEA